MGKAGWAAPEGWALTKALDADSAHSWDKAQNQRWLMSGSESEGRCI